MESYDKERRFVLQKTDPITGSPIAEYAINMDWRKLIALLGIDSKIFECGFHPFSSEVTEVDVLNIKNSIKIEHDFGSDFNRIDTWTFGREAPYLIHSGYELALMLDGRKPLSFFSDLWPNPWLSELLERFEPFVESGKINKKIVDINLSASQKDKMPQYECFREIYFSIIQEEWRINAYIFIKKITESMKWNETLERIEGRLLGYDDWQIDWWIENKFRNQ